MAAEPAPALRARTHPQELPDIVLSSTAKREFISAANELQAQFPRVDPYTETARQTASGGAVLTAILRRALSPADMQLLLAAGESGRPPAVLLRNTPVDINAQRRAHYTAAWFLHALSGVISRNSLVLKSSPDEHGGNLIHEVTPHPSDTRLAQSSSSMGNKPIAWHTENPYDTRNGPPAALALTAVRGDTASRTGLLPVGEILERLSASTIETLERPEYLFSSAASFEKTQSVRAPILTPPDARGYRRLLYLSKEVGPLLKPLTPEGTGAVAEVERALAQSIHDKRHYAPALLEGQTLIFNNAYFPGDGPAGGALHARLDEAAKERLLLRALFYQD